MVVEGPAGIGKTALVAAARRPRARGRAAAAGGARHRARAGVRVRRRAAAARARGPRRRRRAAFEGAARYAAALLDVPLAEPAPLPLGPEGAFAVLHGLYRLTANLARRRPLALLVDDAHWADARVAAVPGLPREPARPGARSCSSSPRGRSASPGAPRSPRCWPRAALRRCCARRRSATTRRRSSCAPPSPRPSTPLCRSCHALTGGNPFFLRELAGALREAGADRAADVLGAAPDGVVASVRARLARFPRPAQRLAGAAAIMGDGALVRHAAALAELDDQRGRRGRRRAARRPDPGRHAARCGSCTRSSAARSTSSCRRPRARPATSARRACSPTEDAAAGAGGRASARDRAARLRVGLRPAPRRRARGGAARRARRVGHLPAARARGAAVPRQPPRRAAGARARGVAHARPRAGDRAPAARRRDDEGHRRAALRGAHARGDGRHERPVAGRRDRRARARGQPRRGPGPGPAHRGVTWSAWAASR